MNSSRAIAILIGAAALAAVLRNPQDAEGAPCGGAAACQCGDTVNGTATLAADLGPCPSIGLNVTSGSTLDCAGHTILGTGGSGALYGANVDSATGATVKNCRITGFGRGMRIRGGDSNVLVGNETWNNTYGVDLAGATGAGLTTNNRIDGNLIRDSLDEGIHMGTGAQACDVVDNDFVHNAYENIYLLNAIGNTIEGNTSEDPGAAAFYIKHSSGNVFRKNVARDKPVQIRGTSSGNLFDGNILDGVGFTFQAYQEDPPVGWTFPHDNTVHQGYVVLPGGVCFRFQGAYDNTVDHTVITGCTPVQNSTLGGQPAVNNMVTVIEAVADVDGDGIDNPWDPCTDSDGDGFGNPFFSSNTCPDDDCPTVYDPLQKDSDGDGIGDACDVCPNLASQNQTDTDGDGIGDECDPCTDVDGDGFGVPGDSCPVDNCPERYNPDQTDTDGDGIGDRCDNCPILPNPDQLPSDACQPIPLARLTIAQAATFDAGLQRFAEIETPQSGLGPAYNGASCAECHNSPTLGGASLRRITLFGQSGAGGFDPLAAHGGPDLQERGITTASCSQSPETVPAEANAVAQRDTPAAFGAGLIDGIVDKTILRRADPNDKNHDGISGRPNMIGGRVGRYGWKAAAVSLDDFVAQHALHEIGITSPAYPAELQPSGAPPTCDPALDPEDDGSGVAGSATFLRLLAPLAVPKATTETRLGRRSFRKAKCQLCHVEKLRTGTSAIAALRGKPVPLYSDLLLHDMGPALADGIAQGDATGSEFRTAPLWGVGKSAPYLHDGRAATLEDAIAAHDGEAAGSRNRYLALSPIERSTLIAFLKSL